MNQFAEKYAMSVESSYLPFDYPKFRSADFRASTMRPLFAYGERCAEAGRLWTTMDETMATVAAAPPASARRAAHGLQTPECPRRDVMTTVAGTR